MAKKRKLTAAVAEALEIPQEIATKQLRLTLKGREAVWVENHQGLIGYGPRQIVCRTGEGLLEIRGQGPNKTAPVSGRPRA